jgi:hypothetical protein
MTSRREPKKSESIEIRLSHEAKIAFMRKCAGDGISASEAIRTMIDERVSPHTIVATRGSRWRTGLAIAAGMALGIGATAPALAHAGQTNHAAFDSLDRNHDGVISYYGFRSS